MSLSKSVLIKKFLKEYHKFYRSHERNSHVEVFPIKLYTRKSHRVYNGNVYRCLDIATINVDDEYRNMGIFTDLLTALVDQYSTENFYIESVLNPIVESVAVRQGFVIQRYDAGCNLFLIR